MAYTLHDMKRICAEMSEGAGEDVRKALQELSRNYEDAIANSPPSEDGLRKPGKLSCAKYLALTYVLLILPLMWWMHQSYRRPPEPEGRKVERVMDWRSSTGDSAVFRTYAFNMKQEADAAIVAYEEMLLLPPSHFTIEAYGTNTWRFGTIRSSDGTDPIVNGRKYWLVSP